MTGRDDDFDDDNELETYRLPAAGGPAVAGASLCVVRPEGPSVHALPAAGLVLIGRSRECDVRVDDPSISRRHAALELAPGVVRLRDLGSANGVRVGGRTLAREECVTLARDEAIELGGVTLLLRGLGAAPAARAGGPRASGAEAPRVVARAPAMVALFDQVARVAASRVNVLVLGETGAGKEVVADALHRASPRGGHAFVQLNCAALSEALLESELFGHEKGAFTGASSAKEGLLESADGGTVFLDEIGEMPLGLQAKLLRVVEDQKVLRVGSLRPRAVDVRFVAATNRDLKAEVAAGRFRQDLYFRLNGVSLWVPPLRERVVEIEPLARLFAARAAAPAPGPAFAPEALSLLETYSWPGNVRELRNVVERAVLMCGGGPVTSAHLPPELAQPASVPAGARPVAASASDAGPPHDARLAQLRGALEAHERRRVLEALEKCAGNQTRAAEMLGMSRRTLIERLKAFDLPRPRKRPQDT